MTLDSELANKLVEAIPELRSAYEKELEWWGGEQPGAHVVYGNLLNPYLISLLESGNRPEVVRRVFDFLEMLASTHEKLIQEVVQMTVLEQLTGENEEWFIAAWPYMGPTTRQLAKEIAHFWGHSPNFPFE